MQDQVKKVVLYPPNPKLTAEAACTWGDGPDVALNFYDGQELTGYHDLTADSARELAQQLVVAANVSDGLDASYSAHLEDFDPKIIAELRKIFCK